MSWHQDGTYSGAHTCLLPWGCVCRCAHTAGPEKGHLGPGPDLELGCTDEAALIPCPLVRGGSLKHDQGAPPSRPQGWPPGPRMPALLLTGPEQSGRAGQAAGVVWPTQHPCATSMQTVDQERSSVRPHKVLHGPWLVSPGALAHSRRPLAGLSQASVQSAPRDVGWSQAVLVPV